MLFSLSFCTPPGKFKWFTSLDRDDFMLHTFTKNAHNKKPSNRGEIIISYTFSLVKGFYKKYLYFSKKYSGDPNMFFTI